MSVPTDKVIDQVLIQVKLKATNLSLDYRYLVGTAYERPKRGTGGGSSSSPCRKCNATGMVCERCHNPLSGDGLCPEGCAVGVEVCPDCGGDKGFMASLDQVGSALLATSGHRRHIETAAKSIFQALNYLERAQAALNDASTILDRGNQDAPLREERTLDHPADKGDLNRARSAQGRRAARAETSGDYSEVTG